MATRLDRVEKDIQKTKSRIAESQKQLRELETQKTEQGSLQITRLMRDMNIEPKEFAAFLRSGTMQTALAATLYHEQEDNAHEE